MRLHYFGLVALGLVGTACGLGAGADIGNDSTNQPIGSSGASGASQSTGGASHSTGGATHASGGASHSTGGATHASGGATQSSGGSSQSTGGSSGGVKCGSKTCPSGEVCCNASCGVCTPPGFACDAIACVPNAADAGSGPCIDNVACIKGTTWSPTQCKCVPNAADAGRMCADIVFCISGSVWSATECKCVPTTGGTCSTAADCHLVSDYCGGCNCLSLAPGEKQPACATTPVACLIDPCSTKTAACVGGHCVAQ